MPPHPDDDARATPLAEGDAVPPAAEAPPGRRRWLPRRRRPEQDAPPGGPASGDNASVNGAGDPAPTDPPPGDLPPGDPPPADPLLPPPHDKRAAGLRRRRRRLLTRREEAVYHLGGLAFELYRRDQLGEEVMRRRAGEVALLDDTVRDIDARLGEIDRVRRERRRRPDPSAAVGNCLDCRAPFRAEARFCWQCGARLVPSSEGDEQPTATIAPRPQAGDAPGGPG